MNEVHVFSLFIIAILINLFRRWQFEKKRKLRIEYYRNEYLNSEEWKRKRFLVLKRDNWKCVKCGAKAEQVHHKRYAKMNIGKEPISWLISLCKKCHEAEHN